MHSLDTISIMELKIDRTFSFLVHSSAERIREIYCKYIRIAWIINMDVK